MSQKTGHAAVSCMKSIVSVHRCKWDPGMWKHGRWINPRKVPIGCNPDAPRCEAEKSKHVSIGRDAMSGASWALQLCRRYVLLTVIWRRSRGNLCHPTFPLGEIFLCTGIERSPTASLAVMLQSRDDTATIGNIKEPPVSIKRLDSWNPVHN